MKLDWPLLGSKVTVYVLISNSFATCSSKVVSLSIISSSFSVNEARESLTLANLVS